MKDKEVELLKQLAEIRRPPKPKQVINYSSENESQYDEDEIDRLKSVGINVGSHKNKNKRQEIDPRIKAEKEALLHQKQTAYNQSFRLFNESRNEFCAQRRAFEREHNIVADDCESIHESQERWKFKQEEKYYARLFKKAERHRQAEEEAELARREAERKVPQTAEEEERARIAAEEEAARERVEQEKRALLNREREAFKAAGLGLFDDEAMSRQDEDALYARYKELKKSQRKNRQGPFSNTKDREKWEDDKREYESLQKRFEHDKVRKEADQKKKRDAKRKREAK
jgi:hypothetical protein